MAWLWPLERNQILSEELVEAGLDARKLELQESQRFHCLKTLLIMIMTALLVILKKKKRALTTLTV